MRITFTNADSQNDLLITLPSGSGRAIGPSRSVTLDVPSGSQLSFDTFTTADYFAAVGGAETVGYSTDVDLSPNLTSSLKNRDKSGK
jgi:hypothetical protein